MRVRFKNLYLGLKDQGPFKRFISNFFITGNGLGLFDIRSHQRDDGTPKVMYTKKSSAEKAAASMENKKGVHFSVYKCIFCDGYHLGKNRENKTEKQNEKIEV